MMDLDIRVQSYELKCIQQLPEQALQNTFMVTELVLHDNEQSKNSYRQLMKFELSSCP